MFLIRRDQCFGDAFVSRLSHSSFGITSARCLLRRALDHSSTIMKRETIDSGRNIREWFLGIMADASRSGCGAMLGGWRRKQPEISPRLFVRVAVVRMVINLRSRMTSRRRWEAIHPAPRSIGITFVPTWLRDCRRPDRYANSQDQQRCRQPDHCCCPP